MPQMDGSIRVGTKIETKEAEKELKGLDSSIQKTADKIASLRSKMDALKDVKLPTQEYQEITTQIEKAEQKFNKLIEKQEQMQREGKDSGVAWERLSYQLDEVGNEIKFAKSELQDLVNTGKSFTLGVDTNEYAQMSEQVEQLSSNMQSDQQRAAEIQSALTAEEERLAQIKANATVSEERIVALLDHKRQLTQEIAEMESAGVGYGYQEYDTAQRELAQINSQIKEYLDNVSKIPKHFEETRKKAKSAFSAISNGANSSGNALVAMASKFKSILIAIVILETIRKAIRKVLEYAKEGFKNFAEYSSEFANSIQSMKNAMTTLGNQIAAAFAPIVQLVIPWITKLVNVISTAMTYVAQFIAVLGGKSTFTRAKQVQDGYNKSLDSTAASAKKAYGALAKFDDLDVLQKQEDTSGGSAADAAGDMFEEVPVDFEFKNWLDDILEKLKPILDYFKELKNIFQQGFWDGFGDWQSRLGSIKSSLRTIKDSIVDIFTDPAVLKSAKEWGESVAKMLGSLAGSVASIGLTIATNFVGGIAKYLEQNSGNIKEYLISMFDIWEDINYLFSDLFESISYIFEAFASDQGQQLTANIIGIFSSAFMGVTELASEIFRDIVGIIIQPFVDNKEAFRTALEGFLGVISSITGTIKQGIDDTFSKINEVYEEHIKPFFDSIASGLSDTAGKFMEFWNEDVQPILEKWAEDFDVLWKDHIQPMLDKLIGLLGDAADLLTALWENVLKPLIDWIIENVLPALLPIVEFIRDEVGTAIETITDLISGIVDVISGIIEFLTGVFSGDWKKAWDGICGIFEGIAEVISSIIDGIIGSIDNILSLLDKLSGAVTGTVAGSAMSRIEESMSAQTNTISVADASRIIDNTPHLASGSVIRGGNPFAAILGDQPRGQTNIEAPLDTIKQAFREELSGLNYGGGLNLTIPLNVDGQEFARLTLNDILQEMGRQGYDVDVLGVT